MKNNKSVYYIVYTSNKGTTVKPQVLEGFLFKNGAEAKAKAKELNLNYTNYNFYVIEADSNKIQCGLYSLAAIYLK